MSIVLYIESALVPLTTAIPTATNASSLAASASMTNNPSSTLSPPTPASSPVPPINVDLSATDAKTKKETGPEAHPIQPWIIAAVVLACLAVLGACLAIFWVMRHSRRRKLVYGEKGHLGM